MYSTDSCNVRSKQSRSPVKVYAAIVIRRCKNRNENKTRLSINNAVFHFVKDAPVRPKQLFLHVLCQEALYCVCNA